jgi:hypothetical protein
MFIQLIRESQDLGEVGGHPLFKGKMPQCSREDLTIKSRQGRYHYIFITTS